MGFTGHSLRNRPLVCLALAFFPPVSALLGTASKDPVARAVFLSRLSTLWVRFKVFLDVEQYESTPDFASLDLKEH